MSSSTSSLNSSFSSEEDDLSESEDSDPLSSPESPESPDDQILTQTRLPPQPQYLHQQQQQFLHEYQLHQFQQAMMMNNTYGVDPNLCWDWSVPQINVHTANASMPIAINGNVPMVGLFHPEYHYMRFLPLTFSRSFAHIRSLSLILL